MADGRGEESSDKIVSIESDCFDFNKVNEYVTSKSIAYDGIRLKWCDKFELLKEFIESVFCQRGRWWSAGGTSKRFDSSTAEFVVMWYPGKHNSLTFTGSVGERAKESLVKHCTIRPLDNFKSTQKDQSNCTDFNESLISLNLEIDILKSRVDPMQALMNSQCDTTTSGVCELRNEITLLKIDLEEEKSRNMYLECVVKRLQQEIEIINSYRNGSLNTTRNVDIISMTNNSGEITEACCSVIKKLKDNANVESNHPVLAIKSLVVEQPTILIGETSDDHSISSECCDDGFVLDEVGTDKSIVDKQLTIPMGDSVNDNTLASNNSEIFSDDELIINHKSDQVKVSDHSKTYAQVAALQPPPKKAQLINETFTKNTSTTTQQINDIDDQFKGIPNKRYRTKKLFLSGIAEDVKENNILTYLMKRNIRPTYISVFKKTTFRMRFR